MSVIIIYFDYLFIVLYYLNLFNTIVSAVALNSFIQIMNHPL